MVNRRILTLGGVAASLMMMTGAAIGFGGSANAQMMAASHPAHIHVGTCAAPGEVVAPLSNVGSDYQMDGTPMAGAWMGPESAIAVEASVTTVPVALADIVAGGHTIVAHESDENIANYIACGDIGGMMLGGSDLPVGIAPLNDSGYSGVAWLHDNGDGTTTVSLFLTKSADMMGDMDADMATPTS